MARTSLRSGAALGAVALSFGLLTGTADAPAQESKDAVPDFSGYWQRGGPQPSIFEPMAGVPKPVEDPQPRGDEGGIPWIGDASNPILKPHAAEAIEKRNAFIKAGGEDLPAYSLCWPTGVPQVLNLREPVQFLQEPNQITILYQRDHQVRRVHLNQPHSKDPKPSWYGESVGHYEGKTLVIDTIGQNDKTNIDKFATPHSQDIHVVERYTMAPDGRSMTVEFTVDDPKTFNMVWGGKAMYRRVAGPVTEVICAENNKNASTGKDYPVPMTDKVDF